MDLRQIQRIGTPVVRDAVISYHQSYWLPADETARRCICGDQYGRYPHNVAEDGTPVLCPAHAWLEQRDRLQKELELCGLSMPIPMMSGEYTATESGTAMASQHPLYMEPKVIEVKDKDAADVANKIVAWLHGPKLGPTNTRQHVVAYLHRSQVSTLLLKHRESELQDVILYSACVVLWKNHDLRNMAEWAESLISLRQYGLAIVVKGTLTL